MNTKAHSQPLALSYATPVPQTPPGNRALKVATAFALVPLIVGISCLVGWLLTSWSELQVLGLLTIAGGVVSTAIAFCLLLFHYVPTVTSRSRGAISRWFPTARQWLIMFIIFINYPAAWGCVYIADYVTFHAHQNTF